MADTNLLEGPSRPKSDSPITASLLNTLRGPEFDFVALCSFSCLVHHFGVYISRWFSHFFVCQPTTPPHSFLSLLYNFLLLREPYLRYYTAIRVSMRILQHAFPSFTFVMTRRSESPALPDYYRHTRQEVYGPHSRSSIAMAFDEMRTIDGREGGIYQYRCSSYLLPDISEEEGNIELDTIYDYSLKTADFESTYTPSQSHIYKIRFRRIKYMIAMILKKCSYRRRKTAIVRPASSISIDLSD